MAVLTKAKRKKLGDSSFAYPEQRKLPIGDAAHVRAAIGRFSQTTFSTIADMRRAARQIVKAAKRHKVELSPSSHVARAAGEGLSGQRKVKRRTNPTKANPELQAARRMSEEFHGTSSEVIALSDKERLLPKYVVALGKMPALEYEPDRKSKQGNYRFVHESGDRGPLAPKSQKKPVLAVDPRTGRPVIVPMGSPMKLDPNRGLVG